jgi:hypothetical protein
MMQVPDSPENAGQCICSGCPTYNEYMSERAQILFCIYITHGEAGGGPHLLP